MQGKTARETLKRESIPDEEEQDATIKSLILKNQAQFTRDRLVILAILLLNLLATLYLHPPAPYLLTYAITSLSSIVQVYTSQIEALRPPTSSLIWITAVVSSFICAGITVDVGSASSVLVNAIPPLSALLTGGFLQGYPY